MTRSSFYRQQNFFSEKSLEGVPAEGDPKRHHENQFTFHGNEREGEGAEKG